jgi:hypothetical protein
MTRRPSNLPKVPNPPSAPSAPLKPKRSAPRRSEAEVLAAIPGTFGVITAVARRLGVDRDTVMNYRARWPSVQAALKAEGERLLDLAEAKLFKRALEDENERCLFYLLDNKGRSRGYGRQSVEVQHTGEVTHAHRVTVEPAVVGSALDLLRELGAIPAAPVPAAVDPAQPLPQAARRDDGPPR